MSVSQYSSSSSPIDHHCRCLSSFALENKLDTLSDREDMFNISSSTHPCFFQSFTTCRDTLFEHKGSFQYRVNDVIGNWVSTHQSRAVFDFYSKEHK